MFVDLPQDVRGNGKPDLFQSPSLCSSGARFSFGILVRSGSGMS